MTDSNNDACPAITLGSQLAGELIYSLDEAQLSHRNRMLAWLGLFAELRASCEQQLGRETSAVVFQQVEAVVRTERVKLQH
jgi:hypothetical protein